MVKYFTKVINGEIRQRVQINGINFDLSELEQEEKYSEYLISLLK